MLFACQKTITIDLITNGLTRIYLNELLVYINKKDNRSAVRWCENNNVTIYKDSSGKFIIQSEFEFAYNQPIISEYKARYGNEWEKMFESSKKNNHSNIQTNPNQNNRRYYAKSKMSKNLLKKRNKIKYETKS